MSAIANSELRLNWIYSGRKHIGAGVCCVLVLMPRRATSDLFYSAFNALFSPLLLSRSLSFIRETSSSVQLARSSKFSNAAIKSSRGLSRNGAMLYSSFFFAPKVQLHDSLLM
jgi:hypothetical protein